MGLRLRVGKKWKTGDELILHELSIPLKPLKRKKVGLVSWQKQTLGWVKLNVDGSSLRNPRSIGAGGVICDDQGTLKLAFAKYIGQGMNNAAEFLALYYGLLHCREPRFNNVEIEMDSLLIINWFKKGRCDIWYLEDFWEEIFVILSGMQVRFKHIYCEGNTSVDYLA